MSSKVKLGNAYQRRLVREAKALGWTWSFSGRGHLRFAWEGRTVYASATPKSSDQAFKKTMSKLRRRAGYSIA